MPIGSLFQTRWLDFVVDGHPIKEWCQCIKHEPTKARCTYCNVVIRFDRGPGCLKQHAFSKRHKRNRKVARLGRKEDEDFSGEYLKPQETRDALALLYPGMNFDCSVDLLPLSVLYKASRRARTSDLISLLRRLIKPRTRNAFIDVYICFFCGQEFVSLSTLHGHQKECGMTPPDFLAHFKQHYGKSSVHQHESIALPLSIMYQSSGEKMLSTLSTTNRQTTTCSYVRPSRDTFISALDLLPKKSAELVCNRRRNTECEIIDLDEDIPISPTLPRTPKLLLSHLSRDGYENSADNSSLCGVRRSLFGFQNSQTEEEHSARMESSDERKKDNMGKEKTRIACAKSLYSIDITSPLGQLVIKHFKGDPKLHVLSDVESHCLTSTPKKIVPTIELRERHNTYPVTFKGLSGKLRCSHEHQYKFTRQQKVEFLRRVNTGLDKKSRVLQRKMKRCTVRLTRITKADLKRWMLSTDEVTVDLKPLSADEITYWTSKDFVDINSNKPAEFPSGLTFSSSNVNNFLGPKTCRVVIKSSIRNLEPVSSIKECASKAEVSRTGKRKFRESKSVLKKSLGATAPKNDVLKQDCLKSCGIFKPKRRKVDNVIEKSKRSITSTSTTKASAVSKLKFSKPGRYSAKVEVTRAAKVSKGAVQRLTGDPLRPNSQKKPNTPQVREVERARQGSETEDCNTFVEEIGHRHKRGISNKPISWYKKFATVGSFGNSSLLNVNKGLTQQKNTYSCNLFHASGQQGKKNITENKKHVYSPKLYTFCSKRTEENAVNINYSILKKMHQISHLNNTAEVAETKDIENRSAILDNTDSRSYKSVQEVQNSFVQTNISSDPISFPWKDKLADSKVISQKTIPSTGFRFVTYSSSVSPQLRQSSLINTMSISRKAEIRKSDLASFLSKPNGKSLSTFLIKSPLKKSRKPAEHTQARKQFRQTPGSRKRK